MARGLHPKQDVVPAAGPSTNGMQPGGPGAPPPTEPLVIVDDRSPEDVRTFVPCRVEGMAVFDAAGLPCLGGGRGRGWAVRCAQGPCSLGAPSREAEGPPPRSGVRVQCTCSMATTARRAMESLHHVAHRRPGRPGTAWRGWWRRCRWPTCTPRWPRGAPSACAAPATRGTTATCTAGAPSRPGWPRATAGTPTTSTSCGTTARRAPRSTPTPWVQRTCRGAIPARPRSWRRCGGDSSAAAAPCGCCTRSSARTGSGASWPGWRTS